MLKQISILTITVGLYGCAATKPAWEYYDACSRNASFHEKIVCGREAREAACTAHKTCSTDGDNVVAYADSLDASVAKHEISEEEAQRKWIEFRIARANELQQRRNAAANSDPVTCYTANHVTTCN